MIYIERLVPGDTARSIVGTSVSGQDTIFLSRHHQYPGNAEEQERGTSKRSAIGFYYHKAFKISSIGLIFAGFPLFNGKLLYVVRSHPLSDHDAILPPLKCMLSIILCI